MKPHHRSFNCELAAIVLTAVIAFACWVIWSNWPEKPQANDPHPAAFEHDAKLGAMWGRAFDGLRKRTVEP